MNDKKRLELEQQQRSRLEALEQRTLKLKSDALENTHNNISAKKIDDNENTRYNINVTQKPSGYKVTIEKYEFRNTRNTRVGIDPLRLLQGKSGLRIYFGRKNQENKLLSKLEFTFERSKWDRQLNQWCLENNLNHEIKLKIGDEINKIIRVENVL